MSGSAVASVVRAPPAAGRKQPSRTAEATQQAEVCAYGVLYFRIRRLCAEKVDDCGCCDGGRRGGDRAVEGAALEDQAAAGIPDFGVGRRRSEERRVGKECRSRGWG